MNTLCHLAATWSGEIPLGGAMIETKVDGFRALRFRGIDGVTRLWSRNGVPLEGVGHILHRLARMEAMFGEPLMFDGEFQVEGTLDATKRWCEAGWKLGGEAGVYHAFDVLPLSAWRDDDDPTPLYSRKQVLAQLMEATAEDEWTWRPGSRGRDEGAIAVQTVADEWVTDPRDALAFAKRVWASKGEGAMLKVCDAPYRRTRSAAWQKIKPGGPWWKGMMT